MRALSNVTEDGVARKKAKIETEGGGDDDDDDDDEDRQLLCAAAFGLFRNYLEDTTEDEDDDCGVSDNNHNGMSAIDDLVKLVESNSVKSLENEPLSSISNETDILSILASVAYCLLASAAIQQYLEGKNNVSLQHAQGLIDKSLSFFPCNAACWSMAANFGRITETLTAKAVTEWYQQAAELARRIRREALQLLDRTDIEDSTKEWIELLLLQQIVGVEYVVDDDDDDDDHHHQDDIDDGHFSSSSVEGTSRFMAAILLSRGNRHEEASRQLQNFSLTHRLHPNVWTGHGSINSHALHNSTSKAVPLSFRNVLPPKLYQQMCTVFAPDAAFWRESDYSNRGYYSFLTEINGNQKPRHLIDEVVLRHLLPLAKQFLEKNAANNEADEICVYEWWAHSRQASLGHTLHFDTDEANLGSGQQPTDVHHPLLSSVLYLTGDETSGVTILLDQVPDSELAQVCWRSVPHPNTFMVFPGNLLHGVLPCRQGTVECDGHQPPNCSTSTRGSKDQWTQPTTSSSAKHRLTFMVGFKTRIVPDQRQDKCMYGPCAPLPPESEEWVREIQGEYKKPSCDESCRERWFEDVESKELPCVSPAFECISNHHERDVVPPLEVPSGIDQRFFVNGAPECFRKTLFENDDD